MSSHRFPAAVDEITVRLVAAVVLSLGIVALATQQWWVYAILAVDFWLRSAVGPRWSPVARVVQQWVRPAVGTDPVRVPGAPKRFAAAIGAVLTSAATVLWLIHGVTGSSAALAVLVGVAVVMLVFPALEAVFGLCVGCRLFAGLVRLGMVPESICLECADITRRQRIVAVP
ncbi:MAG: DUF4395 domain-containing protein [Intrasporangium sp.]|uniref:DUF4395 domain-containing protein n=1 Tax=Intrasporangium sp. TaxID=1925024 RepID=UPI0026474684|nr:DUF4395 domain-containing protein [Intrasporangium sp.]MDN5796991.1 DUF4395 domain-containing protein [Intrasporangium sp.]